MKKDWKAGMLAPAEARREEKVFVPVMQRARICLFHKSVFYLVRIWELGPEERTPSVGEREKKNLTQKQAPTKTASS